MHCEPAMLDGVSTVFMSGIHSHDRNVILKYCVENNIRNLRYPRIGDTIMSGAYPMHMFHLPMLKVGVTIRSQSICSLNVCWTS